MINMEMGWIGDFLMTTIDERFKNHFFEKRLEIFYYVRKKLYLCCVDKLTVEFE